jgi:cyclic pyranopterin phosphate synthase
MTAVIDVLDFLCDNQFVETFAGPLTDAFGRVHDYLRISITDRCNFRCVYCMPSDFSDWKPKTELLSFEEIVRAAEVFAKLGVRRIRITGGEPTVRKGYIDLVKQLRAIDGIESVGMTTNGSSLMEHAIQLADAGLDSVNVSLDSLQPEKFALITGRDDFRRVFIGINTAIEVGLKVKINVVVLPGVNDSEVLDFAELTRDLPFSVRFIEFMPFLENGWRPGKVVKSHELLMLLSKSFELTSLDLEKSAVAREYQIAGCEGKLGFISSVSDSFCSGCNRIRLTADGQLKSCLFLAPNGSIRDLLRSDVSDRELIEVIQKCLKSKWKEHPPMTNWQQRDNLTMVQIGG